MFSIGWIKKSYMFVCVCICECVMCFKSVDTAGGLYHVGINEVRIRGALLRKYPIYSSGGL